MISTNTMEYLATLSWIDLCSVAASCICLFAIVIDTFHGLKNYEFWLPCKYFSLNVPTLILISVATKLLFDLNTSMPQKQDQLSKLTSSVLACTLLGTLPPSLGSLKNKELLIYMPALAIYVITTQVNICIQLHNGVIHMLCREHVVVLFLMLFMYGILVSSALTIPTTKAYFEDIYRKKHEEIVSAYKSPTNLRGITQRLKDDLRKHWIIMAQTSDPQHVVGRLATSTISGVVCLLNGVVLAKAIFQSMKSYKLSLNPVLVVHILAIVMSSFGPAYRWFTAINIVCPVTVSSGESLKAHFKMEDYWTKSLRVWEEHPFVLGVLGQVCRKILQVCIGAQIAMVVFCKFIRLVSIFLAGCPSLIVKYGDDAWGDMFPNRYRGSESPSSNSADGTSQ